MDWLNKNFKYVIIILVVLTCFKSCQSCNRNMSIKKIQKECMHDQDSLKNRINILQDSIKNIKYKLELAKEQTTAAERRATSIQTVAEKIKSNSTTVVKIENNSPKEKEKEKL